MLECLHSQDDIEGSGIGLATCKRIVENHGGRIWCRSNEGGGSTFILSLDRGSGVVPPGDNQCPGASKFLDHAKLL